MDDPYAVLGLERGAGPAEIKAAYRALAKVWHPDRHRGDPVARERFVEISDAYQSLAADSRSASGMQGFTDFARRRRAKAAAAKRAPPEPQAQREAEAHASDDEMLERIFGISPQSRPTLDDAPGIDDIPQEPKRETDAEPAEMARPDEAAPSNGRTVLLALNALFGRRNRQGRAEGNRQDTETSLAGRAQVSLGTVLTGGTVEAVLDDGRSLFVPVPKGVADGSVILSAAEENSLGKAVEVTVRYEQTDAFSCAGSDIHTSLTIDLETAVLGGRRAVQTIDGSIRVTVPSWSGSDRTLRVAGRGLPKDGDERGDLFVHLRVLLPETPDPRIIELMKERKEGFYV